MNQVSQNSGGGANSQTTTVSLLSPTTLLQTPSIPTTTHTTSTNGIGHNDQKIIQNPETPSTSYKPSTNNNTLIPLNSMQLMNSSGK